MEELQSLASQQDALIEEIDQLVTNFRKDSSSRKTAEYLQKKLQLLENIWGQFEEIDSLLEKKAPESFPYLTNEVYLTGQRKYEAAKALISTFPPTFVVPKENIKQNPSTSKGAESRTDELLRKQSSHFKAFTRTISNVDLETMSEKWELEDALRSLIARWAVIDTLHWEIDSELDGSNTVYEKAFNTHERQFNQIKKAINSKLWSVAHREKSTPQMEIPEFSGNFHQWVSFKDLFYETIHNNPSLSNAQKMQFLKGKVKGEAERLIQHLKISSDNYNTCWEILNNRFDNKKLIFTSHMNILTGLSNMQQQTYGQLKRIHDVTLECTHAIKNLGVDMTTWDPILVYLLSQKLDPESYSEYTESVTNKRELPVLQEFINFLENKFTSLESSRRKQDQPQKSNQGYNTYSPKKHTNAHQERNIANNKPIAKSFHAGFKCPLCNSDHGLYNCKEFLEMSNDMKLKTINKLQVCINCLFSHNGKQCTSYQKCRKCAKQHNTMIHDACANAKAAVQQSPKPSTSSAHNNNSKKHEQVTNSAHVSQPQENISEILLATALVKIRAADGAYHVMRALVDQGSQISLITENAAQTLGLKRESFKGVVVGIGQKENNCKGFVNITCNSVYSDFIFNVDCLIMKKLIRNLPNQTFQKPFWPFIENINLADPEFYNSRPIDLILGAEVYSNIIMGGIVKGENESQPIAQQTHLGWLLCGSVKTSYQCNVVLNNLEDLQQFWEVEEITENEKLTTDDQHCIDYFLQTTERRDDGRYIVRLPMKENFGAELGESKHIAAAQFRNLERKLQRQESLAKEYRKFMLDYEDLEHMKRVNKNNETEYYLPHHGVLSASKFRVVFNASMNTSSGKSLNDLMYKGPNLQQDLQSLILKWRQYKYAFTADIEKMYRQILVNNMDQHLQKIVWRESPEQPLTTYQLTTVTYGTKAAPFLAMITLKKLATDEKANFPEAAKVLEEEFYMDDLVHGADSIEHGKKLINGLDALLKAGGFTLRKWTSNNEKLLENVDQTQRKQEPKFNFKSEDASKTLGLSWNPTEDTFTFRCNMSSETTISTKRTLLSEISKLYDPLGWLTPVTTSLKILFQKIWKSNIQWDDIVPENINNEWSKLRADIHNINHCIIPRWIGCHDSDVIQLHGFCDASMQAYAGVVYARIPDNNQQNSKVILVAAKTKLVPTKKTITLPRLELMGAQLLTKLMSKIIACLSSHKIEAYGWCDSMVVLGWLKGDPGRWKPFVANRVQQITDNMPPETWRYVNTSENPADAASRGLLASQLVEHSLWWNGPAWLSSFRQDTEQEQPVYITEEEQKKRCNIIQDNKQNKNIIDDLLENKSSITKVTRILAWILRALTPPSKPKGPNYLTVHELRHATRVIVKHVQHNEFKTEIAQLSKQEKIETKSKLLNLNPYLDTEGILRVGGRLNNANLHYEMKHPKIIPHDSSLTHLLIDQAHKLTLHGGPRLTLAFLRQQYWVIGGNGAAKKQIRKCVTCKKNDPNKNYQLMGDLPEARSNSAQPFYHTGVDYTGFVDVKTNKGRGVKTTKGYVAVFVCMVTKAVHLEVVSDLTSAAFLAALRRMAARRGTPRHLYSDNGTNFVKAYRLLKEEITQLQKIHNDDFFAEIAEMNIEWHFNAPSWPSAGGLWERAVRSLKYHLKRVVGDQKLTFEEWSTILAQIEASLNSRPLCALSEDVEDLDFLTPAHFLSGRPGLTIIETEHDARMRWHLTNKLFQDIWKRWKTEYLTQLTARRKWLIPQRNIQIGDLVMVHEDNLPAGKWALARVVELHPGQDGYVRVVTLRTKNGYLKRPVVKLSVLPLKTSADQETEPNITNNKCEQDRKLSNECERDNKTTNNRRKGRKQRTSKTNFITMALLFIFNLMTQAYGSYNITELNANQSLYFDPITKMQLIRDKWTLVVYYNMEPYWEGVTSYNKLTEYLEKVCTNSYVNTHCNMIIPQLRHEYDELEYYNHLLLSQHFTSQTRQKRGLINGVGYLANSLFGVLDERFAEKYTKDIELIQKNEEHLRNLWRNQTSVIESEHNLLKRTEQIMAKQHKSINKHLNRLDEVANNIQGEINNLAQTQDFTLSALTANNILQNLKRVQDSLLDTITDIYHGQYNMHLLTPEQLRTELSLISSQLSDDLTLPIDNIQSDMRGIYQLLKVKARMTEQYLLFELVFPLITRESYKLYRMITIPRHIGANMINIVPISDYIAINLKKDAYVTMSASELASCITRNSDYLCQHNKPVYHLTQDRFYCEQDQENNACQTQRDVCQNKLITLHEPSTYLYYSCYSYTVKILCDDHVTAKQLQNAVLIYLKQGCILKSPEFTLHSQHTHENKLNIDSDIYIPKIDQINTLFKIDIPNEVGMNESETAELDNALLKIDKQLKQMKENNSQLSDLSPHDVHQYAVSYTVLVLAVACAVIALACWWRRQRQSAVISPNIELHQLSVASASGVSASARKQSITADRQPSEQVKHNISCSPVPRKQCFC